MHGFTANLVRSNSIPVAIFHFHFQSVFRFENSLTIIVMSDPALFSVFGFELRINCLTCIAWQQAEKEFLKTEKCGELNQTPRKKGGGYHVVTMYFE